MNKNFHLAMLWIFLCFWLLVQKSSEQNNPSFAPWNLMVKIKAQTTDKFKMLRNQLWSLLSSRSKTKMVDWTKKQLVGIELIFTTFRVNLAVTQQFSQT